MPLFRRRDETLNEKLLREAGYGADGTKPHDASPPTHVSPLPEPHVLTYAAPPGWDAVVVAVAPGLQAPTYDFATVPDGSLIVPETCDEDLAPLADAIESRLEPPYRAKAVRQNDRQWFVSGRRIEVVQLAADGDELALSSVDGDRIFTVDGAPADPASAPPELAALGEREGRDYAVRATLIDGDLWEVQSDPL